MFNPQAAHASTFRKSRNGLSEWVYREVNPPAFDFYVKFLKTRNTSWLINAEREV